MFESLHTLNGPEVTIYIHLGHCVAFTLVNHPEKDTLELLKYFDISPCNSLTQERYQETHKGEPHKGQRQNFSSIRNIHS